MINIAICFEDSAQLQFTYNELYRCFDRRGVECNIYCRQSAVLLMRDVQKKKIPDILFYSMDAEYGLVRMAAFSLKKLNPKLVSVVLPDRSYKPLEEDARLAPIYILPGKSQKQLHTYAHLAYEAVFDANDTFSYYKRPSYVHIPFCNIKYFVSEGRRIHIARADSKPQDDFFYKKMSELENFLTEKDRRGFFRIHQSYLINADYVADYSRRHVILTTGEKLPISRYEYYMDIRNFVNAKRIKRLSAL